MNIKFRKLALSLLVLLIVLTGCQVVGGLDINKALLNNVKPVSSESSQKLSVEIVPAAGTITKEDKEMIELINSLSLNLENVKVQDQNNISIQGTLGIKGASIPFQLAMDKKGITVTVKGAKQPIFLSLDSYSDLYGMMDVESLEKDAQSFSEQLLTLLLKHAPNPQNISAKSSQEYVNGESLNLTHLHVELTGEQILSLVKPFLSSIVKDEQGLKEIIGSLYDIYANIEAYTEQYYEYEDYEDYEDYEGYDDYEYYEDYEDSGDYENTEDYEDYESYEDEYDYGYLGQSREEFIEELYTEIHTELSDLVNNFDKEVSRLFEDSPEFKTVFGKNTILKVDMYFDNQLNIRKQQIDLVVAVQPSEDMPVSSFKIKYGQDIWNVGGAVQPDRINTSAGVLDMLDYTLTPGKILRNFDASSPVYSLLKDEMKIAEKEIFIDPQNDYYGVISKKNTTFVPLRYLADRLDAEVKWVQKTKQITIIDDITGEQIILNIGSKKAKVNGKVINLPEAPFIHTDGATYIPLRFIAESLGATVEVDEYGWITIERE